MIKTQKGVTLTSLVIYITVFMIVLAIIATISHYFYGNVTELQRPLGSATEYNKFQMFFANDTKKNKSADVSEDGAKLVFEDGTTYYYSSKKLYRNNIEIVKNIENLTFQLSTTSVGDVTKKIVNVKLSFTQDSRVSQEENNGTDYVLKYW